MCVSCCWYGTQEALYKAENTGNRSNSLLLSIHSYVSDKQYLYARIYLDVIGKYICTYMYLRQIYFTSYLLNVSNCRTWCPGNPDCDDPKLLCQDLVDDYHAFQVSIHVRMIFVKNFTPAYFP